MGYYIAGFVFGLTAILLIFGAVIGMFLHPIPRVYGICMDVLTIVLLVSSTICLWTYAREMWVGLHPVNAFERYTFTHLRLRSWASWVLMLAAFAPQFFWLRRFRRSFLVILVIATTASSEMLVNRFVTTVKTSAVEFPRR